MVKVENLTNTEKRILQAATEVFLEKGKDGARMQEIAGKAGINKALLHYYFRSKEQLYRRVFASEVRRFFDALLNATPPTEQIQSFLQYFINSYLDQLAARPRMMRFISWEIQQDMGVFKEILKEVLLDSEDSPLFRFRGIIQKAMQEGEIRPVSFPQFMLSLLGMCVYPFLAQPVVETIYPDIRVNDPEFLRQRKQEIFNLIWRGIAQK